jgi:hypothetical protein
MVDGGATNPDGILVTVPSNSSSISNSSPPPACPWQHRQEKRFWLLMVVRFAVAAVGFGNRRSGIGRELPTGFFRCRSERKISVLLDVYEETITGTTKGAGVGAAPIADPPFKCKRFFLFLDYSDFAHVYQ